MRIAETSNTVLNELLSFGAGKLKHGNAFDKPLLLTRGLFDQSVILRDRKQQVQQFLSLVWERWSSAVRWLSI